ncbi:MAG: OmpA family protein [Candidatus Kapabacteria bacterium]|nr:OmpA family protein [Candidatus Kapabacteria bacterium]
MNRSILHIALCLAALALVSGCGTPRKSVEEQLRDGDIGLDTKKQTVFLTGTKPVEQVTEPSKLVYDIMRIEANGYPDSVRLFARVFDSTGSFITNLAPPVHPTQEYWKSLTEKLGKRTVRIGNFTVREFGDGDSIPYAIHLLIDYSGSMNGVLDALYEGTELFIALKQPYDNIAISTFNRSYDAKVPFMSNRSALLSEFRAKRDNNFGMYSALYDALLKSVVAFDTLPESMPRILVAFSDGDDNFSKTKAREIFLAAKQRNVHVFTVGFGYTQDDVLNYVAQNTGGKHYRVYSKADLINVFKEIYRSLRNYYLVTYKPPKFAGLHRVSLGLQVPNSDTLFATGEYDKSDLDPTSEINDAFSKPILFDYNQATIRPESDIMLDEMADQLERRERIWLEVQGHTDNTGTEEYNQRLSERRAQAVVDALVRRGIATKRLVPVGKGMMFPLKPNDSEENKAINRRTEFRILKK